MRGVGSLPPPGLEDAALSGDLEHPLQQALVRAAGQKTISKLAEHAEVKARVRQLEAEQVLPVDPRPDRLSGLSITQALAELHQRDQGQPPGCAGRLALLGIEVGEVAILEDLPECIAQGEIGAAFGKGGASDAGGLFGHTWERLVRLERHNEASRDHRSNAALDLPSHPFANGIRPGVGRSDRAMIQGSAWPSACTMATWVRARFPVSATFSNLCSPRAKQSAKVVSPPLSNTRRSCLQRNRQPQP